MSGAKAEAVEPETRQKLALYFACADAWHARMVQARVCEYVGFHDLEDGWYLPSENISK